LENIKRKFKAGVVQFDVQKGQVKYNLGKVFKLLAKLASDNVDLAVLPEMFSCSFDNENLEGHSLETKTIIRELSVFARENKIAIVGTLPERVQDKIYNTMMFIDTDGIVKGYYRKLHLFRLTGEHLFYTAGNEIVSIDSNLGRIGLMICYDLRFPELSRSLFLKDTQIIVVSAQWPESRKEHWQILIKARAIENQVFMVCSNRIGIQDDLSFPGMSVVVDPAGTVLADAKQGETSVYADIKMEQLENIRATIPCAKDRRQDIYG